MMKRKIIKNVEKEQVQQSKEIKSLLIEGKSMYQKAVTDFDFEAAFKLFTAAIPNSSSKKTANLNNIYHMRGLCQLKLRNFDKAQQDFNQAVFLSNGKDKIEIYNSLGKCKLQKLFTQEKYLETESINLQLQQAIKFFEKSWDLSNKTDGDACFNLGKIFKKLKKINNAIEYFSEAIKNVKHEEQYLVYIQRGICYRDLDKVENSTSDLIKALQIKKDDPFANFHLGINYMMNSDYQNALQKLSAAIEYQKNQPQFYNYKGLALYMSGQYQLCLSVFNQALKLYDQSKITNSQVAECYYNLANALINLARYNQALQALEKAKNVTIDEDLEIKVLYSEGRAYEAVSSSKSVSKFQQVLLKISNQSQNDLYLPALYHLGCCQSEHEMYSKAIQSFDKIIDLNCCDFCVYVERGKAYLKNQNYDKALKDFETVLRMDQNYPDAYFYIGMSKIYSKQDQMVEEGLQDLFTALQLGSKHAGIYNGISCAFSHAKKFQKALVYSNICLSHKPQKQQFLMQRSLIYRELGQHQKSIEDLSTALVINKKDSLIHYNRGLAYFKNKEFEKCIADFENSLKLSPNKDIQSDIYYQIGIAYSKLEKLNNAIEYFTCAINLQQKPKYYHQRAKCSIQVQENLQALNDLNQVIKNQPKNSFAYFRRGFAYKALRMYEEAAEDFYKAKELNPDDHRLVINKKQIYKIKYIKLCEVGQEQ